MQRGYILTAPKRGPFLVQDWPKQQLEKDTTELLIGLPMQRIFEEGSARTYTQQKM